MIRNIAIGFGLACLTLGQASAQQDPQMTQWFNDLAAEVKTDRNNHGQLTGDGVSGAEAYAQLANFAEDLEDASLSSLMGIFEAPEPLQATQEKPDETLIPSVTWSFPLRMNLLSPQDRVKNREAVEGDDQ